MTSNWDGEMGLLEFDDVKDVVPNALARLSRNLNPRNYDSSGMGPGLDVVDETRTCINHNLSESVEVTTRDMVIGEDRVRQVRHLSLAVFRRLLVNHFAILFSQNNIVWLNRQRKKIRMLLTGN